MKPQRRGMRKQKVVVLSMLLSLFQINLGIAKTEFKLINIDILPSILLENPALNDEIYYKIELKSGFSSWGLINDGFLNKIDLKLERCKARTEIVEKVKDKAIKKSSALDKLVIFGLPFSFSLGMAVGVMLMKK